MNDLGASAVVGVGIGGLWLAQLVGVPTPSAVEYVQGMVIGVLGAFCWQFIKTQKARETAAASGARGPDLPRLDFYTLGLAMGGAPLSTGLLIWVIHSAGGTAANWLSFGLFLGAGAAGPQYVPALVDAIARFITWLGGVATRMLAAAFGGHTS